MRINKVICDCCGVEVENRPYSVEHFVHVGPNYNRSQGHSELIDNKLYSKSGRTETRDYCLPCYNELFKAFFDKEAELKLKHNDSRQSN